MVSPANTIHGRALFVILNPKYFDRKLVFVCSPYSGDTETHISNTRRYCRFVFDRGAVPFAPHLYFPQFMDEADAEQRNVSMGAGLVVLAEADELWVFGDKLTDEMRLELEVADGFGIPMKFFGDDCKGGRCLDDLR